MLNLPTWRYKMTDNRWGFHGGPVPQSGFHLRLLVQKGVPLYDDSGCVCQASLEAWENETPVLKEETILDKAGLRGNRLAQCLTKASIRLGTR